MSSIVGALFISVVGFLNYFFDLIVLPASQSDTDYLILKISYLIQTNILNAITSTSMSQGSNWTLENIVSIVAAVIAIAAAIASFWQAKEGRKEAKEAKRANELTQQAAELQAVMDWRNDFIRLFEPGYEETDEFKVDFCASMSNLFYLFNRGQIPTSIFIVWLHAIAVSVKPAQWENYIRYLKNIDGEDSKIVLFYTPILAIAEEYDGVLNTTTGPLANEAFNASCSSVRDHVRDWESTDG